MEASDRKVVKRKNFRIYNTFTLLQTIYSDLTLKQINTIDKEDIDTIEEVYVHYLLEIIYALNKRGLYTQYVSIEDVLLDSPKGRINIAKSVTTQSLQKQKLVCSYDELSTNVEHNKIIKTALKNILFNYKFKDKTVNKIRKTMAYFNGIDYTDYKKINWKRIIYNNFNIRYKPAIQLCEKLHNFSLADRNNESTLEDKLYITFKEYLLNFYKEKFKEILSIDTLITDFNPLDKRIEVIVSKINRYIVLKYENKGIIIGCRKYEQDMQYKEFDTQLKEIKQASYKYLSENDVKLTGVLIHCNASTNLIGQDMQIYNVDNFEVAYTTVDLDIDYKYIEYKLKKIPEVLLNIKLNNKEK